MKLRKTFKLTVCGHNISRLARPFFSLEFNIYCRCWVLVWLRARDLSHPQKLSTITLITERAIVLNSVLISPCTTRNKPSRRQGVLKRLLINSNLRRSPFQVPLMFGVSSSQYPPWRILPFFNEVRPSPAEFGHEEPGIDLEVCVSFLKKCEDLLRF